MQKNSVNILARLEPEIKPEVQFEPSKAEHLEAEKQTLTETWENCAVHRGRSRESGERSQCDPSAKFAQKSKSIREPAAYLQIVSVSVAERIAVDPKENRYILLIQPYNVRACAGQYSAAEVYEIVRAARGWDWHLDERHRPRCLPALEKLIDSIIKRFAVRGGEA